MSWASVLNTAWMWKCAGEARAFRRAVGRVAETQAAILREIVSRNQDTEFGIAHRFRAIRTPEEYGQRVPLSTHESYAAALDRIAAGQANVLTRERVELLEPTSGTTGGVKLIPFTASLRRQFQRGVASWIADLFRQRPAVRAGRAYWSISPALGSARRSPGGIPIGFDDDAAYLGRLERYALAHLLVTPSGLARCDNLQSFRYATLLCLLRVEDLALVSIWNPTFLPALLSSLAEWQERLCDDLRTGRFQPPTPVDGALARQLGGKRGDPRRAERVEAILHTGGSPAEKYRQLWPRLALLSCWADAAAARSLDQLRELFPDVEIQPKGLLATEGCVSFPLVDRPAPVLAVRSHFFEFEELAGGMCRLAHELERGGIYRVILTTGGGLYRYQLRDEVEIVGFEQQCPLLRFRGKSDRMSDLVGEKLSEPHVRGVLDRLFAARGLTPRFTLLVPVLDRPARYRLYVQGVAETASLATALQEGLDENPYYRHAVQVGQLAPVEVRVLAADGKPGWSIYESCCLARGQKLGNIKPAALDAWPGWVEVFEGRGNQQELTTGSGPITR